MGGHRDKVIKLGVCLAKPDSPVRPASLRLRSTEPSLELWAQGFVPSFHLECWWNQSLMSHLSPSAGTLKHTRYDLAFFSLPTCLSWVQAKVSISPSPQESGYSLCVNSMRVLLRFLFQLINLSERGHGGSVARYILSVTLFWWWMAFLTNPTRLLVRFSLCGMSVFRNRLCISISHVTSIEILVWFITWLIRSSAVQFRCSLLPEDLCILTCFSAHYVCNEWLFEFLAGLLSALSRHYKAEGSLNVFCTILVPILFTVGKIFIFEVRILTQRLWTELASLSLLSLCHLPEFIRIIQVCSA